ncbi:MAG: hypothetical protein CfP315_0939 [Candidatus Improbicoccus pseudotrichonymphae]|uniref:Uncharacterized protein n=1 Tax=Candidatus Improbicoccus pseudotrichonymphae TaxID=3033792 RepID=A0AA48HYZ7_9FIRM|nr:MAG: hypothetical protein CfP315_0939 [Candidatus Improbicoccus pseudotrichonymphae]
MKKESNGIGENKNSKKISKNNKIISSILAVIMYFQPVVVINSSASSETVWPTEQLDFLDGDDNLDILECIDESKKEDLNLDKNKKSEKSKELKLSLKDKLKVGSIVLAISAGIAVVYKLSCGLIHYFAYLSAMFHPINNLTDPYKNFEEIDPIEIDYGYSINWSEYRKVNQKGYSFIYWVLGCLPDKDIREIVLQCYSNVLTKGKQEEYLRLIEKKVLEKVLENNNGFREYVQSEYDEIIKNFKKVQDKVLTESYFEGISDENQKNFITNLGIIIIFLYLSSISRGGLGYESGTINQGVDYFRIIAMVAMERLLGIINNGGLPENYKKFKGELGNRLEEFKEIEESGVCAQVIFGKFFSYIRSSIRCYGFHPPILHNFVEKLPKNWEI